MRKITYASIAIFCLVACHKDPDTKFCYECQMEGTTYYDVGCMTEQQYSDAEFTDFLGNPLDKDSKCRKK